MADGEDAIAEYCARMFQIRKTVMQMMKDRNYDVAEDHADTLHKFKRNLTENGAVADPGKLTVRARKEIKPSDPQHETTINRAIVLFSGKRDKFAIDDVKFFFAQIDQEWTSNSMDWKHDVLVAVFVIHKNITSFAKKFMVSEHQRRNQGVADGVPKMNFSFNVFFEVELVVNITQHEIVPKHELLTPAEKEELLKKYMVREDQLPRILITDPVAKYCGLRRGDVVRIHRESETAGRYITYRVCL